MGNKNIKERIPKFNPEFSYLENPEILDLQRLFDDILAGDKNIRTNKIPIFRGKWRRLLQKYSEKARTDDSYLRQLIKFFRDNLRILDKGGMLLSRSEIGILMSEENEKLLKRYRNKVEEMENLNNIVKK